LVHIADELLTLTDVLGAADAAATWRKRRDASRQFYRPHDSEVFLRRARWNGCPAAASAPGRRFVLHAQESTRSGSIPRDNHYELLVRMLDEHDKIVPPMAFIRPRTLQHDALIDQWVIQRRVRQDQSLGPRVHGGTYAINIRARRSGTNASSIRSRAVQALRHAPWTICFELTERRRSPISTRRRRFFGELKSWRLFSLDDFGAGMSLSDTSALTRGLSPRSTAAS